MTERLGGTWLVEFVVSSSNLAYRTIGLSVLSFDLPIPPVFHPCLKMCQLTNHRSIVSHIYATNLVVVRRGVLRRRQDPPRDRLSHGRSRVSASEICEQPIPCLDQCVYNIDLGTHLPDESQTDDNRLGMRQRKVVTSKCYSHAFSSFQRSSTETSVLVWTNPGRLPFPPRPHSGLIQHWRLEPDSIRVLSRIATPLEATLPT
jgi:hypothetical protein